jgi:alditol oxidase
MRRKNWAGNYEYRAARLHRPRTVDELREVVHRAARVKVLGTRHAFNDIADTEGDHVSMEHFDRALAIEPTREGAGVTVEGGITYGQLCPRLREAGYALRNLASLPHISVAGAVATATHGSGDGNGNLATAVAALELVTAGGEVVTARRGDRDFDGMVVGLGALGAVTRLTLDVEPAYEVRQRVFEGLAWDTLHERFDAITSAGHSVSVFTRWGETTDQVWVKSRVDPDTPEAVRADLFGAPAATVDRHPIIGIDPVNCTPQLGRPGRWSDRLPHFRMGFTPSAGEEIQSEYLIPRPHGRDAIEAVRALCDVVRPVLQVSEIRTVAADRLWLSPQYGTDTVAIHFTWTREPDRVADAVERLDAALAPFGARPHWGKLFAARAQTIAERYERLPDFRALAERLDPGGAFRNAWLERHVLGAG